MPGENCGTCQHWRPDEGKRFACASCAQELVFPGTAESCACPCHRHEPGTCRFWLPDVNLRWSPSRRGTWCLHWAAFPPLWNGRRPPA